MAGYTSSLDLYPGFESEGEWLNSNALPIIHVDTFGGRSILQLDEKGELVCSPDAPLDIMVHEFQHLIFASVEYLSSGAAGEPTYEGDKYQTEDYTWMTELNSAAAVAASYPDIALCEYLPNWYSQSAGYADVTENFIANAHEAVRPFGKYRIHAGESVFTWTNNRDAYSMSVFLALFCMERGGEEVFAKINTLWRENRSMEGGYPPAQAVYEALGYEDFRSFFTDFLLCFTLHNDEYPLSSRVDLDLLKPVVTVSQQEMKLSPGGFILIKPTGGVYTPPDTASEGLDYIGITMGG